MGKLRVGLGLLFGFLAVACGGNASESESSGGGNSGGQATAGASAGAPGGGTASGGTAGGMTTGGAATAGAGPVACDGTWPAATSLLPPEMGILLFSPALSPNALELIYARKDAEVVTFQRSTRASTADAFPPGTPLPELDSVCMPSDWRSADISSDGLRIYVACYSTAGEQIGPAALHMAERASLTAAFVYAAATQMVGPGAAISTDELTLYTSSDQEPGLFPPHQFVRTDRAQPFGEKMPIPGLEALNWSAPDISSDDLVIYGGLNSNVVYAKRDSATGTFGPPAMVFTASSTLEQLGAPELSRDCRTLVYLRQTSEPAAGTVTSELMISRR